MSLRFIEEFYVMTIKNNAKIGKELTCCYMRNLTNLDLRA